MAAPFTNECVSGFGTSLGKGHAGTKKASVTLHRESIGYKIVFIGLIGVSRRLTDGLGMTRRNGGGSFEPFFQRDR